MIGENAQNFNEYLKKARKYCSYSERCIFETSARLKQLGATANQIATIIDILVHDGFLDEGRFASIFARSKLNQNKWGRIKIGHELSARKIAPDCIRAALMDLDEQLYEETLNKIIAQKVSGLKGFPEGQIKSKTIAFCLSKGFEPELCLPLIENFLKH